MKKRICAVIMVRNDEFFLRKWVEYYARQLGKENLYIYFDGTDQSVPDFCQGTNTLVCERMQGKVAASDRKRIDFLSAQAQHLLKEYDMVIGTDVDEFLTVDPNLNMSLVDFLSSLPKESSYSGLGIDIGQNLSCEAEIDPNRPFLEQRSYALLSTRYTKTSVITEPVQWGSGFHRVRGKNYHIIPNLYLFHFGCIDLNRIKSKLADSDKIKSGWGRHLKKRAGTIRTISRSKAKQWEKYIPIATKLQSTIRKVQAWNKPAMLGWKIIVQIPPRFTGII